MNVLLGQKFKTVRRMQHKTQQDVADMLGICRSTYCYYEIGRTQPTYQALFAISEFFGVSLYYFMNDEIPYSEYESYLLKKNPKQ